MKQDVVFFGESVPRDQVAAAQGSPRRGRRHARRRLVVMVYSGFRFAQWRRVAAFRSRPSIWGGPEPAIF
jgi:hypothetical protein